MFSPSRSRMNPDADPLIRTVLGCTCSRSGSVSCRSRRISAKGSVRTARTGPRSRIARRLVGMAKTLSCDPPPAKEGTSKRAAPVPTGSSTTRGSNRRVEGFVNARRPVARSPTTTRVRLRSMSASRTWLPMTNSRQTTRSSSAKSAATRRLVPTELETDHTRHQHGRDHCPCSTRQHRRDRRQGAARTRRLGGQEAEPRQHERRRPPPPCDQAHSQCFSPPVRRCMPRVSLTRRCVIAVRRGHALGAETPCRALAGRLSRW